MNKFNEKKFYQFTKNYKSILDYGCGNGILPQSNKKVYLYDIDKNLYPILKKKYKKKKFFKILNKPKFSGIDVFFMNSVFQYLNYLQLRKIKKKMKKFKIIIISDIPKYPRIIEAIFLIFLNPARLISGIISFLKKEKLYTRLSFYSYSTKKIVNTFKGFNIKIIPNLNDVKFVRYTIILKNKINFTITLDSQNK